MEDAYARSQGFPTKITLIILAGIAVIFWGFFGSGYQVKEQEVQIPTVWMVYAGDTYTGLMDSYCWLGKCYNATAHERQGAIRVANNSKISLVTNSIVEHSSMNVNAEKEGKVVELQRVEDDYRKDSYIIELEKGAYILRVYTEWKDLGYVTFLFNIDVV